MVMKYLMEVHILINIKASHIFHCRVIVGKSNSFILFPGTSDSDIGLLRKTSLAMMYNGPFSVVQSIVDAFNVRKPKA